MNAVRTEVDGIKFASKGEAARYIVLKNMQKEGKIRKLELQPKYDFDGCGITYRPDFRYQERKTGNKWQEIVEDFKGQATYPFKMKVKLMKYFYDIDIRITSMTATQVRRILDGQG